jgi:ABC-type lipoprotein release transport system permease subunit
VHIGRRVVKPKWHTSYFRSVRQLSVSDSVLPVGSIGDLVVCVGRVEPAGDPLTYATVPVLLGIVALAACFIPVIRATRVSPVETLRY